MSTLPSVSLPSPCSPMIVHRWPSLRPSLIALCRELRPTHVRLTSAAAAATNDYYDCDDNRNNNNNSSNLLKKKRPRDGECGSGGETISGTYHPHFYSYSYSGGPSRRVPCKTKDDEEKEEEWVYLQLDFDEETATTELPQQQLINTTPTIIGSTTKRGSYCAWIVLPRLPPAVPSTPRSSASSALVGLRRTAAMSLLEVAKLQRQLALFSLFYGFPTALSVQTEGGGGAGCVSSAMDWSRRLDGVLGTSLFLTLPPPLESSHPPIIRPAFSSSSSLKVSALVNINVPPLSSETLQTLLEERRQRTDNDKQTNTAALVRIIDNNPQQQQQSQQHPRHPHHCSLLLLQCAVDGVVVSPVPVAVQHAVSRMMQSSCSLSDWLRPLHAAGRNNNDDVEEITRRAVSLATAPAPSNSSGNDDDEVDNDKCSWECFLFEPSDTIARCSSFDPSWSVALLEPNGPLVANLTLLVHVDRSLYQKLLLVPRNMPSSSSSFPTTIVTHKEESRSCSSVAPTLSSKPTIATTTTTSTNHLTRRNRKEEREGGDPVGSSSIVDELAAHMEATLYQLTEQHPSLLYRAGASPSGAASSTSSSSSSVARLVQSIAESLSRAIAFTAECYQRDELFVSPAPPPHHHHDPTTTPAAAAYHHANDFAAAAAVAPLPLAPLTVAEAFEMEVRRCLQLTPSSSSVCPPPPTPSSSCSSTPLTRVGGGLDVLTIRRAIEKLLV